MIYSFANRVPKMVRQVEKQGNMLQKEIAKVDLRLLEVEMLRYSYVVN